MYSDGSFTTIAAGCIKAGTTGYLVITKNWTGLTTQAPTCRLWFQGGILTPAMSNTVTILKGSFCPPDIQCYSTSSGGTIAFSGVPNIVTPIQFGADVSKSAAQVNTAADSSPAFNAAWAAIAATSLGSNGATLTVPCGNYKIGSTLNMSYAFMQKFQAAGACAYLNWYGNNSTPLINAANCFQCVFSDFRINVPSSGSYPLLYGIKTQHDSSGLGFTASKNKFNNIEIEGNGYITTGWVADGPIDANNDQQRLESVLIIGYTHSAFTMGNASTGYNILNVVFDHCGFNGFGGNIGIENFHSSYVWRNGDGGGNSVSDLYFGPGNQPSTVEDSEFEESSQFITTSGPSQAYPQVVIRNTTYGGECVGATAMQIQAGCAGYTSTGNFITWRLGGTLKLDTDNLGTVGPNNITINMTYAPEDTTPGFVIENSIIGSTNTTMATLFPINKPAYFINDAYFAAGGAIYKYKDSILVEQITTSTANSFSSTLAVGGSTTGVTYGSNIGNYFNTGGDTVFLSIHMTLTSKGSGPSGAVTFPIPVTSTVDSGCSIGDLNQVTGLTSPTMYIASGANIVSFFYISAGVQTAVPYSAIANNSTFVFSCLIR